MPAVDVGDDERSRRALDQVERILQLSWVLIRSLLAKLNEGQVVSGLRDHRLGRVRAGVLINRVEMLATAKHDCDNDEKDGGFHEGAIPLLSILAPKVETYLI